MPKAIIPTRKRVGRRETPNASDVLSRDGAVGREGEVERPCFSADRSFVARSYIEIMGARFDGVDGRHRSHAPRSCGSGRESGSSGAEMPKRGVEPAREVRCVRGLVASRRRIVFDTRAAFSSQRKGAQGLEPRGVTTVVRGSHEQARKGLFACDTVKGVSV